MAEINEPSFSVVMDIGSFTAAQPLQQTGDDVSRKLHATDKPWPGVAYSYRI